MMLPSTSTLNQGTEADALASQAIAPGSDLPLLLSRLLVAVAFLAQIYVAWHFWATTWDDSAITLGFARTFAETGRIEPTPGSGIVEGYSTTLWMLLMAAAAKVAATPAALLATAKLATLALNVLNIVLIRAWFCSWTPAPPAKPAASVNPELAASPSSPANQEILANLVAGSMGCGLMFAETINGMETPLMLSLVFGMLLLRGRAGGAARGSYLALGVALLLTRWEAAWLLAPFVLVEAEARRAISSSLTWFAAWLASELARLDYFGSLVPNTILAKRGPPYSSPSSVVRLERHVLEPVHLLLSCKVLLLILLASFLFQWRKGLPLKALVKTGARAIRASWQLRFTWLYVLFSLVLTTAIGANWGPPFRSFYSAWPFLLCLLMMPILSGARLRRQPWITWTTIVLCVLALVHLRNQLVELGSPDPPYYMHGTTVADVAQMSRVLADLQAASHQQDLLYAGPDMGAVMLYSQHIRVLDLGLLCDPVLARRRYAAINDYVLQQRRPDVIEVHLFWTTLTDVGHLEAFRTRYLPVYVEGTRLFVSRALVAAIPPGRLAARSFDAVGRPLSQDLGGNHFISYTTLDNELNREFGQYFVLR